MRRQTIVLFPVSTFKLQFKLQIIPQRAWYTSLFTSLYILPSLCAYVTHISICRYFLFHIPPPHYTRRTCAYVVKYSLASETCAQGTGTGGGGTVTQVGLIGGGTTISLHLNARWKPIVKNTTQMLTSMYVHHPLPPATTDKNNGAKRDELMLTRMYHM